MVPRLPCKHGVCWFATCGRRSFLQRVLAQVHKNELDIYKNANQSLISLAALYRRTSSILAVLLRGNSNDRTSTSRIRCTMRHRFIFDLVLQKHVLLPWHHKVCASKVCSSERQLYSVAEGSTPYLHQTTPLGPRGTALSIFPLVYSQVGVHGSESVGVVICTTQLKASLTALWESTAELSLPRMPAARGIRTDYVASHEKHFFSLGDSPFKLQKHIRNKTCDVMTCQEAHPSFRQIDE